MEQKEGSLNFFMLARTPRFSRIYTLWLASMSIFLLGAEEHHSFETGLVSNSCLLPQFLLISHTHPLLGSKTFYRI